MENNVIAIHQPNFLPWLGYFHKMIHSDVFVFFDDVQFPRGKSFCSRVLIKSPSGEQWLTIPVAGKGDKSLINQVEVNGNAWIKKTLKSLIFNYQKAPFFKELYPGLEQIFKKEQPLLSELNIELIRFIIEYLESDTRLLRSSEIYEGNELPSDEKIIYLLKELNASHYISGSGAGSRRHIDENEFSSNNIQLVWQHFRHPEYPQLFGEFLPNLSIIDLLFNCGSKRSHEILQEIDIEIKG